MARNYKRMAKKTGPDINSIKRVHYVEQNSNYGTERDSR